MVKLNLPKNSSPIRVYYHSNTCHNKNQICLKKIPTFLFYLGFLCEGLRDTYRAFNAQIKLKIGSPRAPWLTINVLKLMALKKRLRNQGSK